MNDQITNKWEKTGLLEGLDEFNKSECAASLEDAALFLMNDLNKYCKEIDKIYDSDGFFAGSVLPIIRRLYNEDEGFPEKMSSFNMRDLIDDFYKFCLFKYELYKNMCSALEDGNAEFIQIYVNEFVNLHK